MANIFLDTNAFNSLAGIDDPELELLKEQINLGNISLSVCTIQIDERLDPKGKRHQDHVQIKDPKERSNYYKSEIISHALNSLMDKGIRISLEKTKMTVLDRSVSRLGYTKLGSKDLGKVYNHLRSELKKCSKNKPELNIIRDAVIAITSLDHDYFITCDRCLYYSWRNTIKENKDILQRYKIPEFIFVKAESKKVAGKILELYKARL